MAAVAETTSRCGISSSTLPASSRAGRAQCRSCAVGAGRLRL
uniref:Uncharacterized protein n=1 Tax=Arundo donax TaxID=35708 RepID=A0A0A8YNU5_ARUDO